MLKNSNVRMTHIVLLVLKDQTASKTVTANNSIVPSQAICLLSSEKKLRVTNN